MAEETMEKKESMPESMDSTPKKSGMKGIVLGIIAVLVIGGVALGLYQWNSGSAMSPEERSAAMVKKVAEIDSVSYDANLTFELGPDGQEEGKAMLKELGVDSDVANLVVTATGSAQGTEEAQNMSADVTVRADNANGEEQLSLGLGLMSLENVFYVRLNTLPEVLSKQLNEQAGLDLSFLQDQWIEVNIDDVADQLGLDAEELAAFEGVTLSKEEEDKVTAALVNNNFFTFTDEGTDEDVNGTATVKYKTEIDIVAFKAFLEEIKPIVVERDMYSEEEYSEMISNLEEDYTEMQEDVNLDFYTWVGKRDNLPYKMEVMLTPTDESDTDELKSITATLELMDHNEEVTLEAPEDAMSVQEVIGQLLLSAGGAQLEDGGEGLEQPEETEE